MHMIDPGDVTYAGARAVNKLNRRRKRARVIAIVAVDAERADQSPRGRRCFSSSFLVMVRPQQSPESFATDNRPVARATVRLLDGKGNNVADPLVRAIFMIMNQVLFDGGPIRWRQS
jgi:hypothetical protein